MVNSSKSTDVFSFIKKPVILAIGRFYKRKQQYEVAAIFYIKALGKNNHDLGASTYYEYADVLYNARRFKASLKQIAIANEVDSGSHEEYKDFRAQLYYEHAYNLYQQKYFYKALKQLNQAMAIDKRQNKKYVNLQDNIYYAHAKELLNMHKFDKALKKVDRALSLDGKDKQKIVELRADIYYQHANVLYKMKEYETTLQQIKAAIECSRGNNTKYLDFFAQIYYAYANDLYQVKNFDKALDKLNQAIAFNHIDNTKLLEFRSQIYYEYAMTLLKAKKYNEAIAQVDHVLEDSGSDEERFIALRSDIYYQHAYALFNAKKHHEALEQINFALDTSQSDNALYRRLRGEIYIWLKQLANAENDLRRSLEIDSEQATSHYLLGITLIKQKKWYESENALLMAKKFGFSSAKFFQRLGQASFEMEHFTTAAEAYYQAASMWDHKTKMSPISKAELYYMAGLSMDFYGDNTTIVNELYNKALEYDGKLNSFKYGIAVFHLEQKLFKKALIAIEHYLEKNMYKKHDLLFEKARILYSMDDLEGAANTLELSLDHDFTQAHRHRVLANIYTTLGESTKAATSYKNAIERTNGFDRSLYMDYIEALTRSGDTIEVEKTLQFMSLINEANSASQFDYNNPVHVVRSYAAMYEELPLNNKTILYECFQGKSFGDNPAAILRELLTRPEFLGCQHIIVLNNHDDLPDDLRSLSNLIVVSRSSFRYAYYMATSKYLITNATFLWWFIRKEGQQYLNTWHGVPWKTLGKDIKIPLLEYDNTQRNFLQTTHMTNPNRYTTNVMTDRYNITDIYNGKLAEVGYPRLDVTLNMSDERKIEIKRQLGVDSGKKLVFYAPTWRGIIDGITDQSEQLEADLNSLSELDCEVIFRGHYYSKSNELVQHEAPRTLSTNELLAVTDILITDYSSVAFDFMATGKQIVYYLYDYESYKAERGLYFEYDELPGRKTFDRGELVSTVKKELEVENYEPDVKYKQAMERFCPNIDGKATKKVIDFFFYGDTSYEVTVANGKQNLIFHIGSLKPNGITTAAINLLNHIDKEKYNVHLVIDSKILRQHKEREEQFDKLDNEIRVIARVRQTICTAKEKRAIAGINIDLVSPSDSDRNLLKAAYRREYRRLTADADVYAVINFSGYAPEYTAIFGYVKGVKKIIYAHSDMYSEYLNKHKNLKVVFDLYKNYDKILSVSKNTHELNKSNLTKNFNIPVSKFDYIDNVQDPDNVIVKSELPLEITTDENLFSEIQCTFMTIGRYSGEKDHEKLIRAFSEVHKKYNNTRLIIIGEGPLHHRLETVIGELNLHDVVHLTGLRSNPYPYLKRSDCFVLPSNYEGQSVVLYEALTLNKPIIATDIIANRGILQGDYGELCNNSINGLIDAMNQFIAGELHLKDFDIEAYNQHAIELFYNKVWEVQDLRLETQYNMDSGVLV